VITVILVGLWQQTGFAMIVYLAALQNVDRELYDASAVDGATPSRQLRYVTLPAIRPATAFISVMSVITSFHIFDIVFVLTAGGPGNTTMTVGLYSYQEAFTTQRQGYGSAIAVVLFLMIVLATVTQWALASRRRVR
jgi:ABC-type sugar transport system permease subunit